MSTAILQSLNKAQQRAVTSNASTVAILAGPGSGKTHTLTARVVWLVQQEGYKPCDIIIATFTVKAAKEMRTRIADALGQKSESTFILGTFHSIARRYLAKYGRLIGLDSKFGIADDGDSRAIIQRICKRLNLGVEPPQAKAWISKRKSKGAPSQPSKQNPATPALLTCFEEYQSHLAKANLLDYDDLLVRCVELLQKHPSCVSNIQAVLIDEYQDTNGIQYELMKLFAQERQRITIVGDPDQSIYGWRSADIRNLQRLLQDFRETEEVALEENYRSSQLILSLALNVIQQDKTRYQKRLVPVHSKGLKPVLRKIKSSIAEGEWIVTEIRRIMMLCGKMLAHEDVAILLRSASLSRHVESALGKAGIAYRMVGGTKFYDRKEIKALLDYLRVINQPDCNDALARIINVPRRGIGETTIKSLLNEAEQASMSLWSLLRRHCRGGRRAKTNIRPKMEQNLAAGLQLIQGLRDKAAQANGTDPLALARLIEHLVDQLRFKDYLKEEYTEDHESRWANVQELVNMARDATRNTEALDEEALPEIEGVEQAQENDVLGRFLANVALASDAQKDDGGGDKKSLVTISTIHAAKGLEWPVVFIPSVYAGSIPHSRSEDSDEERRLLYVAMTRAKASLYLSWPLYGPQGTGCKTELSPFVSPFAAMFAAKGPSLDKCVVRGMAQLLGREMPKDKAIFDQLPVMFSMEDDLFPVDDRTDKRAAKRPRTDCSGEKMDRPWKPDYVTTMDDASKFTMSSLPGFVSAGAHHTAAAMVAPRPREQKRGPMSSNGRRRPDQRSLLGFVTETKATSSFTSTAVSAAPVEAAPPRREAIIDAALAHHKLSNTKLPTRPGASERLDKGTIDKESPEPDAVKALDVGEGQPLKPASSFHATTFASAMQQTGVRRPAGLGPRPSLDRLGTAMLLAIVLFILCFGLGLNGASTEDRRDKYLIGIGKADITGPVAEVRFSGYANFNQVGSGLRQRLYSRAFIIGKNDTKSADRFVYIVLDTQSGDTAIRNGVLDGLLKMGGAYAFYNSSNIALTGTHSHAGPGAWSNYLLPQLPSLGFDKQSYEAIVNGTLLSIKRAHEALREGYIDVGRLRIPDGAINRSLFAWLANPVEERVRYADETDKMMTLLRFTRASDRKITGCLSWFAVHGTSLLGNNTLVAGDNKGVAAWRLEQEFRGKGGIVDDFVAGFSQGSVGDTTPNVLGAYCDDGSGQQCSLEHSTCADGKSQSCHGRGPEFRKLDFGTRSCYEMGRRQYIGAKRILDRDESDFLPIRGSVVKAFHFYHDMRFWQFRLRNGSEAVTCPAALGYSFAAGTSDWPGAFDFRQGKGDGLHPNPLWRFVVGLIREPSDSQKQCHGAKPILLDVGEMDQPYSWAPNIVDMQMFRVGQLLIIVSPSEVTTMSGIRWKAAVAEQAEKLLGIRRPLVVLGGPANTYAHYCVTPEEYQVQRYEGASTLYGPHQLEAFINLTVSNMGYLHHNSVDKPLPGPPPPDNRNKSLSFISPVILDSRPRSSWYGRVLREPNLVYRHGDVVTVSFQAANPRNNLRLEKTYASVERWRVADNKWEEYRNDEDWFLVFQWRRTSVLAGFSEVDISWDTRGNADLGVYRFRYYGDSKSLLSGLQPITGTSGNFTLR
ncbi:hypothetical protein CDD80_1558 [Ophiocordyceps camponoti-rufipedis]|uniref:ceramidase n=1 Tax=Ophiocordyceps camponoti-rufipedis TaxID=2004952 RepID=A0A2C5ZAG1_9HYPO|nr:hypothetical protein CDD80_1558 [Ophiocordyceps camponoti-rufipedis]